MREPKWFEVALIKEFAHRAIRLSGSKWSAPGCNQEKTNSSAHWPIRSGVITLFGVGGLCLPTTTKTTCSASLGPGQMASQKNPCRATYGPGRVLISRSACVTHCMAAKQRLRCMQLQTDCSACVDALQVPILHMRHDEPLCQIMCAQWLSYDTPGANHGWSTRYACMAAASGECRLCSAASMS